MATITQKQSCGQTKHWQYLATLQLSMKGVLVKEFALGFATFAKFSLHSFSKVFKEKSEKTNLELENEQLFRILVSLNFGAK